MKRMPTVVVGVLIVLGALVVYLASNTSRDNFYNHFVWQADAFLRGEAAIPYPLPPSADGPGNAYFNDVYPVSDTEALIPFPPLPAVVLLPLVAAFGMATDQELVAIVLGAVGVGLVWWLLGRLPIRTAVRALVTAFFAVGTVWWWTSAVGTTWYLAHVVALDLTVLAAGLALGADRASARDEPGFDDAPAEGPGEAAGEDAEAAGATDGRGWLRGLVDDTLPLDGRQLLAGLLLGLAATARLPVLFGAPFLVLVGPGDTWLRRAASAGVGAAIPVLLLLGYNVVSTGHLVHPGYEYQYQLEAQGYPTFGYEPSWAIEDVRYIPRNLETMLLSLPAILPDHLPNTLGYTPDVPVCVEPGSTRGLFDVECPLAVPLDVGTSILLVSPAFLLALPALRGWGRSRLVTGAVLAIVAIALLDLAHFSQGWVQWGYRFSNDFVPFALLLVALGAARADGRLRPIAVPLVALSVVVNLWGVVWGNILGW